MKKRVFSLLLAMVMILSTAALAISATETDTETVALPVAENVKGLTVTVDGIKGTNEGWSKTPIFQTKYKVSDPSRKYVDSDEDGILDIDNEGQEKIVVDTNPSSLYISTDGEYVYFYYESTHDDFINGHNSNTWNQALMWNGSKGWSASSLQIYFAPADKANEQSSVADHDGFYLRLATYPDDSYANNVIETSLTTNGGTYVWDHKMGDENKQENGGAWDASQTWTARYFVQHFKNANKAVDSTGVANESYGTDVYGDTHIAMRVEGEHSNYTKLCIEMAFPISEELAEQLQTGTSDYRIATYEQSHSFKEGEVTRNGVTCTDGNLQNAGYVLSDRTLSYTNEEVNGVVYDNWCFPTTCGVTFTLPQAVEVEPPVLDTPEFTMDGIMGENEGWDGVRVYEFDQHVYDATGKDAIHRDDRIDSITGESSIRFSYDAENIYVYYETSNSDTLLQEEGNGGLLLRIVPELGKDMREEGITDGSYFFIWLNLRNSLEHEGKQPTNEDVVGSIWDLIFTDDNHSVWGLGQKTLIAQFGFFGWYDDYGHYSTPFAKNSLIALHVEKDAEGTPIKKSIEMKLPMANVYKERVAANEENGTNDPVFYFTAFERTRQYNGTFEAPTKVPGHEDDVSSPDSIQDYGTSNGGYLVSLDEETPVSWGYNDPGFKQYSRVDYGAPVTSSDMTEYKPEIHTNFGKTVTVDGIMSEDEGWSYSPMFQTVFNTNGSKTDIAANSQPDTNPTTIRISCDGQKVYLFIESTHYDTLNATWYDCNEGKTDENGNALAKDWQTPCFYIHFYPDSDKPRSEYGVDNGHWFSAAFTTFRWYGLKDENLDENNTLIWDMNNPSGTNESLFWRLLYGAESSMQYSKDYCLAGVELAAHIDKNEEGERTKLSIEFAFPLAQEVVAALEDGDLNYKFAIFERTNRYQDMSEAEPKWVTSKDGGYLIEDVYVDSRLKTDETDCGIPVVLKQNTEGVYADFVEWFEDYKANAEYENLKNLVVNFLGDDHFLGGKIADYYKWTTMIDEIYNWNITNYVEEGIMTSTYDNLQVFPLSRLYRSMSSNTPNVVLVSGGLNDYLNGTPIGTIDDTDTNTYMGALKALIDGLRDKYRDACIVFTTVYNFEGSIEGSTLTSEDYATALKEVCEYKKVYCLDLYDAETYGIDMSSAEFRAEYCQSADDTVNLNLEGNKLLLATYEKFVSESLTDWAANKDAMLAAWEATKPASGNNGGNTGNNGGNNSGNNGGDTNNKPAETTPAPAPVEPEKKGGCKGVIGVGSALAVLAIVSCAGAVCFKKHD